MAYVDGFVLPVYTKRLAEYKKIAKVASKVWREHGALEYRESIGDDLSIPGMFSFLQLMKPRKGETVAFSWIVYKSKAHRDRVNAKVMKDPRLAKMMDPKKMPFDFKRMAYGGFKIIVEAKARG